MQEIFVAILGPQLAPFGPVIVLGTIGLILVLITAPAALMKKRNPMDRLKEQRPREAKHGGRDTLRKADGKGDKLEKYSAFLEPQDEKEYSASQLQMLQAGYRSKNAVRIFHLVQFVAAIGTLVVAVVVALVRSQGGELSTQELILSIILPATVGYMFPKRWISKRVEARKEEITNGFPDALDLMLVCVEAGQSLDQAIIRVSQEIRASFPALAEEFEIVSYEIKAGKDKPTVLKDMAERCGVQDVTSFVTVLIQSQSFGTSIAESLRIYAGEMRDKRVMRAEEAANKLPTKMTLVTMLFTVPPLLIILVGPSVYDIVLMFSGEG